MLISACLFGDGAGAAILSSQPADHVRRVEWKAAGSVLCPAERDALRFEQRGGMLRNILTREVPALAAKHVANLLADMLNRHPLKRAEVTGWILHAGGREVLAAAQLEEGSFCSVAGLGLRPQRAIQRSECCVGDALTMIPHVTGNGMSMAFESAELAIEPIARFSRGDLTWAQAQRELASSCDRRFSPRLRWAAWLQRALFQQSACSALLFLAGRSHWFWRRIFERTR